MWLCTTKSGELGYWFISLNSNFPISGLIWKVPFDYRPKKQPLHLATNLFDKHFQFLVYLHSLCTILLTTRAKCLFDIIYFTIIYCIQYFNYVNIYLVFNIYCVLFFVILFLVCKQKKKIQIIYAKFYTIIIYLLLNKK